MQKNSIVALSILVTLIIIMGILSSLFGGKNFSKLTPEEFQSGENAKVIAQLVKAGDILTKERPVEHWIYFKSETDRKSFETKVLKDGFRVTGESKVDAPIYPYQLRIIRSDKVDQISVNGYVMDLWRLAHESNGDYDGWETEVVTN
jgi:hypothetical protein